MVGNRLDGDVFAICRAELRKAECTAIRPLRSTTPLNIEHWRRTLVQTPGLSFSLRALAMWVLGYPEIAHSDASHAVDEAREIGQAAH